MEKYSETTIDRNRMRILNYVIQKMGRRDYKIDEEVNVRDLFLIIFSKIIAFFRAKMALFSVKKIRFVGHGVRILHKRNLTVGTSFNCNNGVYINALARHKCTIGNNVTFQDNVKVDCFGNLSYLSEGFHIGNEVGISHNTYIQVRGRVVIEDNVIIGPNSMIISENHLFANTELPINRQGVSRKGVTIKYGSWIGCGVIILDGVTIGRNSVIAAGALVSKDVPDFEVHGGIPAKLLKKLK